MATGIYFVNPIARLDDANRALLANGTIRFDQPGTTTLETIYSDKDLNTATTNPMTLNSAGLPTTKFYLSPNSDYRIRFFDSGGTEVPGTEIATYTVPGGDNTTDTNATLTALPKPNRNGAKMTVRRRSTANSIGDGSGGVWVWDSASTATTNGGTVLAADAGGTGRWLRQYAGAISVKWFGAVGDGAADDTASIQAAFNAGSDVFIPSGTYNYSSQISIASSIRVFGSGTLNETTLLDKGILVDNVNDVVIEGLKFTGPEDLSAWTGGGSGYRQEFKTFIYFDTCKNCTIRDITSSGKRGVITLDTCQKVRVDNIRHDGFLGDISTPASDGNYYSIVRVSGGRENHLISIEGFSCGSVVLIGTDSTYNTVGQITGREIHDNGVYNSSGDYSTFFGCTFNNTLGSGLKVRGSGHTINGNVVAGSLAPAIALTGNGETPDSLGANGFGTVCTSNTIISPALIAISVGGQDGYFPRDFTINNNTIENHLGTGDNAAILVAAVRGMNIQNNSVRGSTASYAFGIFGASGSDAEGFAISGNRAIDCLVGFRVQDIINSIISDNAVVDGAGDSFDIRTSDNNIINSNSAVGTSGGIDLNSTSQNNLVSSNNASVGGDDGTNTVAPFHTVENGVFTPTYSTTGTDFDSVTYGTTQGTYTKIGKLVRISGIIQTSAITLGSASGTVVIDDLPFANSNDGAGADSAALLTLVGGFSGDHPIGGRIARNESRIQLQYRTAVNGSDTGLAPSDMNTSGLNRIVFSATYFTDTI